GPARRGRRAGAPRPDVPRGRGRARRGPPAGRPRPRRPAGPGRRGRAAAPRRARVVAVAAGPAAGPRPLMASARRPPACPSPHGDARRAPADVLRPRSAVSTDQVSLFFALLALACQIGAVVLVATLAARALAPRAEWPHRVLEAVGPAALPVAALVAVVAMLGSLYYSEVADFPPCRLCWYRRIGMYPLAVVLPIAAWRRDRQVRWYALPLAVAGGAVSIYHILVERFPSLESG